MKVYLGAGRDRKEGFVHVDMMDYPGIAYVWKCPDPLPFTDHSIDHVFTQDFLEHIRPEDKITLINEIWRVLRIGGLMEHWIPNAGSRNDFGSPSHLSHWNLQQFEHFDVDSYRWAKDREYEGFFGAFKKVIAETAASIEEVEGSGIMVPQSIHVVYSKVEVPNA